MVTVPEIEVMKADKAARDEYSSNVVRFVDKFTGEVYRFKSPCNVSESKGFVNKGKDLCRKTDYVPVRDIIARFTRQGMSLTDLAKGVYNEYLHSDDDNLSIDADTLEDNVDIAGDVIDRQLDLENYLQTIQAAGVENSKPVAGNTTTANNSAQGQAEQGQASEASADAQGVD